MRLVCISDTHALHERITVPDGDVLVHAGDFSGRGERGAAEALDAWAAALPHRTKILIAGNHDFCMQEDDAPAFAHWTYLRDAAAHVDGIAFYGSPWQPWFYDWAFNFPPDDGGAAARATWARIPAETAVLVTHGPPRGILDRTTTGIDAGCPELLARIGELPKLRTHVFGHIHEGYGTEARGAVRFVNAATCTVRYKPVNAPLVIDL